MRDAEEHEEPELPRALCESPSFLRVSVLNYLSPAPAQERSTNSTTEFREQPELPLALCESPSVLRLSVLKSLRAEASRDQIERPAIDGAVSDRHLRGADDIG